jgi:hypothetical protein
MRSRWLEAESSIKAPGGGSVVTRHDLPEQACSFAVILAARTRHHRQRRFRRGQPGRGDAARGGDLLLGGCDVSHGGNKRIFPEDGAARPLQLVWSFTAGTGIQICTYHPRRELLRIRAPGRSLG